MIGGGGGRVGGGLLSSLVHPLASKSIVSSKSRLGRCRGAAISQRLGNADVVEVDRAIQHPPIHGMHLKPQQMGRIAPTQVGVHPSELVRDKAHTRPCARTQVHRRRLVEGPLGLAGVMAVIVALKDIPEQLEGIRSAPWQIYPGRKLSLQLEVLGGDLGLVVRLSGEPEVEAERVVLPPRPSVDRIGCLQPVAKPVWTLPPDKPALRSRPRNRNNSESTAAVGSPRWPAKQRAPPARSPCRRSGKPTRDLSPGPAKRPPPLVWSSPGTGSASRQP
jgi:hypothetical protein